MTILGTIEDPIYRAMPELSQSDLAQFRYSPRHFFKRAELRKETAAMKFGTIFHTALLEPKKFKELYLIEPSQIVIMGKTVDVNRRVKAHREYLEAWRMDNVDRMILTDKEADSLTLMITEVSANPFIVSLLEAGQPECVATGEIHGRKMKGKADEYVAKSKHGVILADFKKTQDASQNGFSRSIINYSYDLQAAVYSELFGANKFFIIAVEEKTGAIGIWDMDSFLERGRHLMKTYLEKLSECEKTNHWPWFTGNGPELILPPSWISSVAQDEELIA